MSKMVTVRLDEKMAQSVEAVRDPTRFPTRSDFIREAIRRMVREERRNRVRAEVAEVARDQAEMERLRQLAEEGIGDWIEAVERADRGEG